MFARIITLTWAYFPAMHIELAPCRHEAKGIS